MKKKIVQIMPIEPGWRVRFNITDSTDEYMSYEFAPVIGIGLCDDGDVVPLISYQGYIETPGGNYDAYEGMCPPGSDVPNSYEIYNHGMGLKASRTAGETPGTLYVKWIGQKVVKTK